MHFLVFSCEKPKSIKIRRMTIDLHQWSEITPEGYLLLRKLLGSQGEVANLLGLTTATICLRERGKIQIKREAWLAIVALCREMLDEPNGGPEADQG
ncbi:MAG: hypothetical protein EB117_18185 [Betaproteobacteria bacterium]|nr:hypothetical protein [Betaproteobacteria bacterium]